MNNRSITGKWPLLKYITSAGKNARLSILNYHRVHPKVDPINPGEVDVKRFDWQMKLISNNFNVFTLREAVGLLKAGKLPERSLAITFDDGYADNVSVALPILEQYALKATFFIATGYLDGGKMWNDQIIEAMRKVPSDFLDLSERGLGQYALESWADRHFACIEIIRRVKHLEPGLRQEIVDWIAEFVPAHEEEQLMMRSDQVAYLHQHGMEIGAHTVTHPILATIPDPQAEYEIVQSRKQLEDIIGAAIHVFAYPNGKPGEDYLPRHRDMIAEQGFEAAVSTQWGVSTIETDVNQLRRFTPWDDHPGKFMLRLLRNYYVGRSVFH